MHDLSRTTHDRRQPDVLLRSALVFTLLAHAAAMAAMLLFLLPGVPGGANTEVAARAAHVAGHSWLWRAGWLPWQLTAASDLLLSVALLRTPWFPRLPAALALAATLLGVLPDQAGQFLWTWRGVEVAQRAVAAENFAAYLEFESRVFHLTAGWGPVGYIAGAIGWTWCFAAAGLSSKRLTRLALVTWAVFTLGTVALFLPAELRRTPVIIRSVSAANAAAFVLLMIWLLGITEAVLRRRSPPAAYGGDAPWRHPSVGPLARFCDLLANSRLARAAGHLLPPARMASDITNVVYVNYLVDAHRLEPLVAPPLQLQRLGPDGRYALFTVLTFRHGCFGPACFGPLRRIWPSPLQSNWRIHVFNPATGTRGIQFLTTAITSTPHALVTRLLTDGVPMHVPASARLVRHAQGTIELSIDAGAGSAPDFRGAFTPAREPSMGHPWALCFPTWHDLLAYCVPQDRAMTADPHTGVITRQEIELNIPLECCRPLSESINSKAADDIAGDSPRLSFLVENVRFRLVGQETDV